jgi:histidyl-tRNA synthetase
VVLGIGEGLMDFIIALVAELWAVDMKAEFACCTPRNLGKQIASAGSVERQIPYAVVISPDDLEKGVVQLRILATKQQRLVARDMIVHELQELLGL